MLRFVAKHRYKPQCKELKGIDNQHHIRIIAERHIKQQQNHLVIVSNAMLNISRFSSNGLALMKWISDWKRENDFISFETTWNDNNSNFHSLVITSFWNSKLHNSFIKFHFVNYSTGEKTDFSLLVETFIFAALVIGWNDSKMHARCKCWNVNLIEK